MVRSIAANHALEDGNKRLAVTVLHSTLLVNGYTYLWSDDDAVELMLRCASGETDYVWLAEFIEVWTVIGEPVPLTREAVESAIAERRHFAQDLLEDEPLLAALFRLFQAVVREHARGRIDEASLALVLEMRRRRSG